MGRGQPAQALLPQQEPGGGAGIIALYSGESIIIQNILDNVPFLPECSGSILHSPSVPVHGVHLYDHPVVHLAVLFCTVPAQSKH